LDKFLCQIFLNDLAGKGFSFTVIDHCRIMLRPTLVIVAWGPFPNRGYSMARHAAARESKNKRQQGSCHHPGCSTSRFEDVARAERECIRRSAYLPERERHADASRELAAQAGQASGEGAQAFRRG